MIVVTHEMAFAREVSDHVMFLHNGLIEEQGPPADLFQRPQSERLRYEPIEILTATAVVYIVFIFLLSVTSKLVADGLRKRYGLGA